MDGQLPRARVSLSDQHSRSLVGRRLPDAISGHEPTFLCYNSARAMGIKRCRSGACCETASEGRTQLRFWHVRSITRCVRWAWLTVAIHLPKCSRGRFFPSIQPWSRKLSCHTLKIGKLNHAATLHVETASKTSYSSVSSSCVLMVHADTPTASSPDRVSWPPSTEATDAALGKIATPPPDHRKLLFTSAERQSGLCAVPP